MRKEWEHDFIFCDININPKHWPCVYGCFENFTTLFLDCKRNNPSKKVWDDIYYSENAMLKMTD